MCRLLHLADVHLGAPLGGFGKEAAQRAAEVLDAFRALPEVAVRHRVDAVLIVGDLFDGPRPPEATTIAVRETIRRLAERSIPVFAVPGNHDARALNADLYPQALDGAVVFTDPTFSAPSRLELEGEEVFVYGVAYDAAEEPDPLLGFERASPDGIHVALLHGSTPGAPHWEGGSSLSLSWERLEGIDVDYVALGDLHRFRGPEELKGHPACYPGSFAAVDFTEAGTRGPVLVELSPGASPHLERLSSGVREVSETISVDVSACTSDLDVADRISLDLGDVYPVVLLEGEPAFALDDEAVAAVLSERHGAANVVDASRFFAPTRLEEIARRTTVAGHVARIGLEAVRRAETEEARAAAEQGLRIALRVMEVE